MMSFVFDDQDDGPEYLSDEWFADKTATDVAQELFAVEEEITNITGQLHNSDMREDRGEVWAKNAWKARRHRLNEASILKAKLSLLRHQEHVDQAKAASLAMKAKNRAERNKLVAEQQAIYHERNAGRAEFFVAAAKALLPREKFMEIWGHAEAMEPEHECWSRLPKIKTGQEVG
jgi:uncharacterized hydantoinase/oxoprolinase family protein